jgi:hypothetical protein
MRRSIWWGGANIGGVGFSLRKRLQAEVHATIDARLNEMK